MTDYTPLPSARVKDITGQRFGCLTVIRFSHLNDRHKAVWICACDCGNTRSWTQRHICACQKQCRQCPKEKGWNQPHSPRVYANGTDVPSYKHGGWNTAEYRIWAIMKDRCGNPKSPQYQRYGGRGIYVCDRWKQSFGNFIEDMGPRPSSNHSIDRIDNDGPYSPDNCRWATRIEQQNNRSTTMRLTYNNETHTTTEWAKLVGISSDCIRSRINAGWPVERALAEPPRQPKKPTDSPKR